MKNCNIFKQGYKEPTLTVERVVQGHFLIDAFTSNTLEPLLSRKCFRLVSKDLRAVHKEDIF